MIPSVGSSACATMVRSVCCHPPLCLVNGALDVLINYVRHYLRSLVVLTHYTSHGNRFYVLEACCYEGFSKQRCLVRAKQNGIIAVDVDALA